MKLTHLSLTNFRLFSRLIIDIPPGPIILVGGNAQGKTSLLEAIYYLATFTSFQASHDRQLVNFLANSEPIVVSKIIAHYVISENSSDEERFVPKISRIHDIASGEHSLEVRLILQTNQNNHSPRLQKEVLLDGNKNKITEAVGAFNAVLFLPHMLRIVEGPPEERRRYLNLLLVQVIPRYALNLTEYNRCLTQRNALLKLLAERGGNKDQLDYWDEQISVLGAQLIQARIQAIQALERSATDHHYALTGTKEVLRLSYQPSFDPLPTHPNQYKLPIDTIYDRSHLSFETIQKGFKEQLRNNRNEEILRGVTTVGPHRDEFRLLSNGIDLGIYGSRGQVRTAVLSLKLAEVAWMKEMTGQWPVLLLDEVLAELDPDRRNDLLALLLESEQAMLTTTDLDLFSSEFIKSTTHWEISAGRLLRDKYNTLGN